MDGEQELFYDAGTMDTMKSGYLLIKRFFDLLIVAVGSPVALLVTLTLALMVRISSGRPVFFAQERAGKGMKPFVMYKFRTMRNDIDPFGPSPKSGDDPRITPVGKFLRLTSLDELPQLWNVLKGEMSLVGPRPLYMEQAREWNQRQRRRLEVAPGLTGLAQISGRGSLTIEEKLELDVQYVERFGFWLDARLLLATAYKLAVPHDIYEKHYSQMEKTRGEKTAGSKGNAEAGR